MNTLIFIGLLVCVSVACASALPAEVASEPRADLAPVEEVDAEALQGEESRRYGGGRYYGGYGRGGYGGYGGGFGQGYGGGYGRGFGGGYGGGYGRGYGGGYGYGGRGYGWGR